MNVGRASLGGCQDGQVGVPSEVGVDAALCAGSTGREEESLVGVGPPSGPREGRWLETRSLPLRLAPPCSPPPSHLCPSSLPLSLHLHADLRRPAHPGLGCTAGNLLRSPSPSHLRPLPPPTHTCMQTSVAPRAQASAARREISSRGTTYDGPRSCSSALPLLKAQNWHLRVCFSSERGVVGRCLGCVRKTRVFSPHRSESQYAWPSYHVLSGSL